MRGLHRPWRDSVGLAVDGDIGIAPGLQHQIEAGVEPFRNGLGRETEGGGVFRIGPARDAEVNSTARQHVERRNLLRQTQGLMQRQHQHRKADADAAGARGDHCGEDQWRQTGAALVRICATLEMFLVDPDRLEPELLRSLGKRQHGGVIAGLKPAAAAGKAKGERCHR